jgi:hypothetical protein
MMVEAEPVAVPRPVEVLLLFTGKELQGWQATDHRSAAARDSRGGRVSRAVLPSMHLRDERPAEGR